MTVLGDSSLPDTAATVTVHAADQRHHAQHDLAEIAPLAQREARVRAKATALIGAKQSDAIWAALNHANGIDLEAFGAVLRAE